MIDNLIAKAVRRALSAATAAVSVPVTITRGDRSVSVTAGLGMSKWELDSGSPIMTEIRSTDLLFAAEDYDFGDGPVEPRDGDLYEIVDGQMTLTLEANPYPPEPSWRYMDRFRSHLRVHTKQVDEEVAE